MAEPTNKIVHISEFQKHESIHEIIQKYDKFYGDNK